MSLSAVLCSVVAIFISVVMLWGGNRMVSIIGNIILVATTGILAYKFYLNSDNRVWLWGLLSFASFCNLIHKFKN